MSAATQPEHIYTFDDLAAMPDDRQRYEIIGGELFVSPAPILDHQDVVGELFFLIKSFLRERDLGRVYVAPADVKFSPHHVVAPDVMFIRRDRLHIRRRAFVDGAPDLVVEVLADSSRRRDQVQKRALYAMAGVPEYWLIDPAVRTMTVLSLVDEQYTPVSANDAGHVSSVVLPGFHLDPTTFFDILFP